MQRLRGFTLIETIIVVALIAVALTISLSVLTTRGKEQQAERLVNQASTEMAMLARATTSYFTADRVATLTVNAVAELQVTTLITEGLLPANFALRGGVLGTSVFGQRYQIRFMRVAATSTTPTVAAFVVTETGVPAVASLSRAGIPNTVDGILNLKTRIAARISEEHKLSTGAIPANSRTVQGGFRGFTKDLTAFIPTVPTQALVAVLGNFSDLSSTVQLPGPPGGNSGSLQCNIINGVTGTCFRNRFGSWQSTPCWGQSALDAGTHYREPTLPANSVNVVRIPICGAGLNIVSTGVAGVALTTATGARNYQVTLPTCTDNFGNQYPEATGTTSETIQSLRLNDTTVFEEVCGMSVFTRNFTTCQPINQGTLTDAGRVLQTVPVTTTTINGTQTWNPLAPMAGNTRSTGDASTRGHWFYCIAN